MTAGPVGKAVLLLKPDTRMGHSVARSGWKALPAGMGWRPQSMPSCHCRMLRCWQDPGIRRVKFSPNLKQESSDYPGTKFWLGASILVADEALSRAKLDEPPPPRRDTHSAITPGQETCNTAQP